MKVQIEIAGLLRRPAMAQGRNVVQLELPAGCTAAQAMSLLGYHDDELRALRLSRGDRVLAPGAALRDGDSLILFTAVGGG